MRWSAAKGIGRITQRLAEEPASDVIQCVLDLYQDNTLVHPSTGALDMSAVSDSTWHGASLAIAELARRGLLLPERLTEAMPWVIRVSEDLRACACPMCQQNRS